MKLLIIISFITFISYPRISQSASSYNQSVADSIVADFYKNIEMPPPVFPSEPPSSTIDIKKYHEMIAAWQLQQNRKAFRIWEKDVSYYLNTIAGMKSTGDNFSRLQVIHYCKMVVESNGFQFECGSGNGRVPNGSLYLNVKNWKVVSYEYDNGYVKGVGTVERLKVTDIGGEVSVTFQIRRDGIHITQVQYPMAFNTLLANRHGSLSVNRFYKIVDSYWKQQMISVPNFDEYRQKKDANPFMNSFVALLASSPDTVIEDLIKIDSEYGEILPKEGK